MELVIEFINWVFFLMKNYELVSYIYVCVLEDLSIFKYA